MIDFGNEVCLFFYSLGQYLLQSSLSLLDILNIEVGGYSLLTLLFGSGFLVYVGWVVVKWIIPG